MTEELYVPLTLIDVSEDRARGFDPDWAEALAAMIAVQGLMHPITLREMPDGRYRLVAGLHRLRAFGLRDMPAIPARLSVANTDEQARLEEVMENLGRYGLIALDRCHHLWELKAVWLKLYPQAKRGGDRGNQHTGGKSRNPAFGTSADSDEPVVFDFSRAVAEKIGLGPTQIKQAVRIWHYLSPETKRRLPGTDLAGKMTELKALAELKPPMQARVLDLVLGEAEPENVAQALEFIENGRLPNAIEQRFHTFSRAFAALDEVSLDSLLVANEARVIDSLRRRGRI